MSDWTDRSRNVGERAAILTYRASAGAVLAGLILLVLAAWWGLLAAVAALIATAGAFYAGQAFAEIARLRDGDA